MRRDFSADTNSRDENPINLQTDVQVLAVSAARKVPVGQSNFDLHVPIDAASPSLRQELLDLSIQFSCLKNYLAPSKLVYRGRFGCCGPDIFEIVGFRLSKAHRRFHYLTASISHFGSNTFARLLLVNKFNNTLVVIRT